MNSTLFKDLSSLDLKTDYRTGRDNAIDSFYAPCLESSKNYFRAVGYFRSSIFILTGEYVINFVKSGGVIHLICSPSLTSEDVRAIEEGYADFTTLGFVAGTYGGSSDDTRVSELDISTQIGGSNAMSVLDDAIDMVSSYQALVGAQENILDYQSDYVTATNVAATAAYGNIMDYDLAAETTALASAQIKQNGAMAMLAQANISQDMVAYLLKQFIS